MSEQDNGFPGSKIFSLFDQGKKFTEELLRENERLRHLVAEVTRQKNVLEKQSEAAGVAHLQDKIRVLEADNARLRQEIDREKILAAQIEEENREFANRYVQIERQNTNLINMYVASYQLHASLDFSLVVTAVREIVINMLGAEVFGIYLVDEKIDQLVLVANEGLPGDGGGNLPIDEQMRRILHGPVAADSDPNPSGSRLDEEPIVTVPLQLEDRPIGLVRIYKLLIQKQGLQDVDFELIELLGKHAATAIYSAQLHARSERKRVTLEGVVELIRSSGSGSPKGK
jgi:hypothetical protein